MKKMTQSLGCFDAGEEGYSGWQPLLLVPFYERMDKFY